MREGSDRGCAMTQQTAQQWLSQANLIQCDRYHARITTAACEAFQNRHDSEQNGNWKHGEYSNCPHPCQGCDRLKQCSDRSSTLKSRRIAPSLPIPTGELRVREYVTVVCPVCSEQRQVMVATTMTPGFIAKGGICKGCSRRRNRKKDPVDRNKKVTIKCPTCGKVREMSLRYTQRPGFTGKCAACATNEANRKRGIVPRGDWKKKVDVKCPKCKQVRQVQYGFTVDKTFTGLCAGCAQKAKRHRPYKKDWSSK